MLLADRGLLPALEAGAGSGWSRADSNAYEAAYVLCFVAAGLHLLAAAAFALLRGAARAGGGARVADAEVALAGARLRGAGAPLSDDLARGDSLEGGSSLDVAPGCGAPAPKLAGGARGAWK